MSSVSMQEEIQNATGVLLDKTLWRCTRAGDMAIENVEIF